MVNTMTKFKIKNILLAFVGILFLLLSSRSHVFAQWSSMGTVAQTSVSQASIASDGTNLLVFYRYPNVSLNLDEGIIKKWNGSSWVQLYHPTNECHDPDIAVDGSLISASWHTDLHDLGFGTNANGPWVSTVSTRLYHQYGSTVAIAKGRAYVTFACRYSDGQPYNYMMLHVKSPIGTTGTQLELDGGWRATFTDVGMTPSITGNSSFWYVVSTQQGWLSVQRDYTYLGPFFQSASQGYASNPEIVLYSGDPVVAWEEDSGSNIYIAKWNGSEWIIFGVDTLPGGYFDSLRIATSATDLYAVYTKSTGLPRISVSKWNGIEWSSLDDPSESSSSTISTVEITVHEGQPVIAFVENNVLKVKKWNGGMISSPAGFLPGPQLLLLNE